MAWLGCIDGDAFAAGAQVRCLHGEALGAAADVAHGRVLPRGAAA